jgi:hypothetical protein
VLVETAGAWGRGQTVIDWHGRHKDLAPPCVRIVKAVRREAVERLLVDSTAS